MMYREWYEKVSSTNDVCRQRMETGDFHRIAVAADEQTAGKGRRGRRWESPKGENLYMSLGFRPKIQPMAAPQLTLVMAVAVTRALEELEIEKVQIKWPNDLVLHGKKICGILTEMYMDGENIKSVIIGLGVNVKTSVFPEELQKTAGSIYQETGKVLSRKVLMDKILSRFEEVYPVFLEKEDLSGLQKEYESKLANLHKEVLVLDPKGQYSGIAKGITATGALLVERQGKLEQVSSGEVSVRGLYGYV